MSSRIIMWQKRVYFLQKLSFDRLLFPSTAFKAKDVDASHECIAYMYRAIEKYEFYKKVFYGQQGKAIREWDEKEAGSGHAGPHNGFHIGSSSQCCGENELQYIEENKYGYKGE